VCVFQIEVYFFLLYILGFFSKARRKSHASSTIKWLMDRKSRKKASSKKHSCNDEDEKPCKHHIPSDDELRKYGHVDATVASVMSKLKSADHVSNDTAQPLITTGSSSAAFHGIDDPNTTELLSYPYSEPGSTTKLPDYDLSVIDSTAPLAFVAEGARDSLLQFDQYMTRLSMMDNDSRGHFNRSVSSYVYRHDKTRVPCPGIEILRYYIKDTEFIEVVYYATGALRAYMFFSVNDD
jgi:hypothetical protein